MWKLASKSIAGAIGLKNTVPKPSEAPLHSSEDETPLNDTRDEGLECPICWESFDIVENVPYVLWCGHTLCEYCVVGLQRAVLKFPALPIQLPFFVSCPWCNFLSMRLVHKGNVKFPSKNYYLMWMVESMNGHRSKSRGDNQPIRNLYNGYGSCGRCPEEPSRFNSGEDHAVIGYFNAVRLQRLMHRLSVSFAHLASKFPLIIVLLLTVLYVIPASAAVLALYVFLTSVLALPSLLVFYFAFPSLNWLVREITT